MSENQSRRALQLMDNLKEHGIIVVYGMAALTAVGSFALGIRFFAGLYAEELGLSSWIEGLGAMAAIGFAALIVCYPIGWLLKRWVNAQ